MGDARAPASRRVKKMESLIVRWERKGLGFFVRGGGVREMGNEVAVDVLGEEVQEPMPMCCFILWKSIFQVLIW